MKLYISILLILTANALHIKLQSSLSSEPHRSDCYTQGLFFINNTHLFQSCGLYDQSFFHISEYSTDPFTLKEVYETVIPWKKGIFLEGSTLFKNHIYMMTWQQNIVYKLSLQSLEVIKQLRWQSDGWGLTNNGTHMFCTDSSEKIYLLDEQFQVIESKQILKQDGSKAYQINELEYVDGYIYANIYHDNTYIHKIDYEQAKVIHSFDKSSLIEFERQRNNLHSGQVLNGIAYNKESGKFLLTGKKWSTIFEVQLL